MAMRPYIVGNWKMNGLRAQLAEARAIERGAQRYPAVEVALAPPNTLLQAVSLESETVAVGGQDCHEAPDGPHTGDVSATMLADAGAQFVILGHSERRSEHSESDALIGSKLKAAIGAGLRVILCCGETLAVRESGDAEAVVLAQLRAALPTGVDCAGKITVAYEPVWAIGTGRSATTADIEAMHAAIRSVLQDAYGPVGDTVRILYGGSVKPNNAAEILSVANVAGALVGGASLTAETFLAIIAAATESEVA